MDNNSNTGKPSSNTNPFRILSILYCIFLITYCTLRAWYIAFTHDEAYTVANYMHDDLLNVILYTHSDPNNHMINTVLGKFFSTLFGENWFVFRIPSLIVSYIFIIALLKILNKEVRPVIMFTGLIIITFNPFLLDFFGLARGYSGSFACMAGALYYAGLYLNSEFSKGKYFIYCTALAGLSVLFHLSMLNFFLPFFLLMLAIPWIAQIKERGFHFEKETSKRILNTSTIPVLLFIGFMFFVMPVILKFNRGGEFDFAGKAGFWQNIIGSLIQESYYTQQYPNVEGITSGINIFIWITALGSILFIGLPYFLKKEKKLGLPEFLFLLIIAIVCFIILQHYIMHVPYPVNRFVLFLYLLFMIMAVFILNRIVQLGNIVILAPFVFAAFAGWHMVKTINLDRTQLWAYDTNTPDMLKDLAQISKNDNTVVKPIELGINWLFSPSINYYRRLNKLGYLQEVNRNGLNKRQKYLYLLNEDTAQMKGWRLKKIKEYHRSQSSLFINLDVDTAMPVYTGYLENKDLSNTGFRMEIDSKSIPLSDSLLLQIELKSSIERPNNMPGLQVAWSNGGKPFILDENHGNTTLETNKAQIYYFNFKAPPVQDPKAKLTIRTYVNGDNKCSFYSIKARFYKLVR